MKLLLLFVFAVVRAKTVRFSNVPPRAAVATKTYDLEVPGSAPIRIIEAEPVWSADDVAATTPSYRDGLEHRTTKYKTGKEYVTTQATRTTLGEPTTHEPDYTAAYSPDALNAFLKNYAQHVKPDQKRFTEEPQESAAGPGAEEQDRPKSWGLVGVKYHNHPFEDKKGWVSLEAVPWSTSKISKWQSNHKTGPKPWETGNKPPGHWHLRPQSYDLESSNEDDNFNGYHVNSNPFTGNKNGYNHNTYNSNKHTFNDYDNGNRFNEHKFNKNPNKYGTSTNSYGGFESIFNNNKHSFVTQTSHYNDRNKINVDSDNHNNPNDQYGSHDNGFFEKPHGSYDVHIKPASPFPPKQSSLDPSSGPRPMFGYDQRPLQIRPQLSDWPEEIPSRPSWNKPPPTIFSNNPIPSEWVDRKPSLHADHNSHSHRPVVDDNRDIITDGRPGDFPSKPAPKPQPNHGSSYAERPSNGIHPPNHPENGNGEWVLVSTTKGYQYPKSKHQRSIEVIPESIGARRGIRLTVLPPDENSPVNMTTSHGGLLEVEQTFQSVEESHKEFADRVRAKNTTRPTGHKVYKKPVRHEFLKPQFQVQRRPGKQAVADQNKPDSTALLAAVGAGMVPATMAMLVPFVTGRKRRSVDASAVDDIVPNITSYSSTRAYTL